MLKKLFGFGKNDSTPCACAKACDSKPQVASELTWAKVLGSGCAKCNELEANTKEALASLGMDTDVSHITDFSQMGKYGVMSTPALVLGDKVVAVGKILKKEEIVSYISTEMHNSKGS